MGGVDENDWNHYLLEMIIILTIFVGNGTKLLFKIYEIHVFVSYLSI